jgi:hypothetical protein
LKHQILDLLSFLLFVGSIGYIYGIAGSLDCNVIQPGQALGRLVIGFVLMAIATCMINPSQEGGKTLMARCQTCKRAWNISVLQRIPRTGYECPWCTSKRKKLTRPARVKVSA